MYSIFCPADPQSMRFELVFSYLQFSLSTASLDVSHMTRSRANIMAQGGYVSISERSTSMMIMKIRGLIVVHVHRHIQILCICILF